MDDNTRRMSSAKLNMMYNLVEAEKLHRIVVMLMHGDFDNWSARDQAATIIAEERNIFVRKAKKYIDEINELVS